MPVRFEQYSRLFPVLRLIVCLPPLLVSQWRKFWLAGFPDIILTLNVENIFEKEYCSHLIKDDFFYNPGLNVVTALKFSF